MRKIVLLTTLIVAFAMGHSQVRAASNDDLEQAIKNGLDWLKSQQKSDGSWGRPTARDNHVGRTGLAVKKFECYAIENGIKPLEATGWPYHNQVKDGLNFILSKAYTMPIWEEHDDNPDSDRDGFGVYFVAHKDSDRDDLYNRTYATGIALMAIAQSQCPDGPDGTVNIPGSDIDGWTFYEVVCGTMDYLAFGQVDPSSDGRGGWGYCESYTPPGPSLSGLSNAGWAPLGSASARPLEEQVADQSNTGYVVLGLASAAAKPPHGFNIPILPFVTRELGFWVDYIQCTSGDPYYDGGSGYQHPCIMVNTLKTGTLLFEMALVGRLSGNPTVDRAIAYLVKHWDDRNRDPGWWGCYQAMYCIMKGLKAQDLKTIGDDNIDWHSDLARYILDPTHINNEPVGASWGPCLRGDRMLCTVWALLALEPDCVPPLLVDVFCDDCADDVGRIPSADDCGGKIYLSEDIWVTDMAGTRRDNPVLDRNNRLYSRVWNIGTRGTDKITTVQYWWADFGYGWPPDGFDRVMDDEGNVQEDEIATPPPGSYYEQYVIWHPRSEADVTKHRCIFVKLLNDEDVNGSGWDSNWDNNIGWRNFTVESLKDSTSAEDTLFWFAEVEFKVGNPDNTSEHDVLSHVSLELPSDWSFELMSPGLVWLSDTVFAFYNMAPSEVKAVTLVVSAPDGAQNDSARIDFTGFMDDTTLLGGIGLKVIAPRIPPVVKIEKTHETVQGQYQLVSITFENIDLEMGGFDFLIAYDASALSPTEVTPSQLLEDCGWEYFTYRYGADGNCGDACPSGLLRIVALADISNGPNHPSCYGPPDTDPHELAKMRFLVTNDRTFECQYVPIRFFWGDCGDNSISSIGGDILYIDRTIYDFGGSLIWDEEDDDQFPEDARIPFVGAPDYCLNPDPDKPSAIRFIDFVNGGIDIICADSIDTRGDINLNQVPNEIADAVLFSNYFVYGLSVFTVNPEGQVAASDVNADGLTLSVADLVYLIRIVVGDAQPYPKVTPLVANACVENGVLSIDAEMGAAFVLVEGNITPALLAGNMEMKYSYDGEHDVTRILVFSMEKGQTFKGEFLGNLAHNVMAAEMAAYDGTPVKLGLIPTEYALHPNFPNPFNPITTIAFALPVTTDYELTIYNSLGQNVETFSGHSEPGIVTVEWNASAHASGVYFYKLTAGTFTDTKKMVLLK